MKTFDLLICGECAGELACPNDGAMSFSYRDDYTGPDVSVAMPHLPRNNAAFSTGTVLPWVLGLLPDNPLARSKMAAECSCHANDTISLLEHFGLELPGAVQLLALGATGFSVSPEPRLELVSDYEIKKRLTPIENNVSGWAADGENWSLGGNQSKLALRRINGRWYRCLGSAATSHIIKPGIDGMLFEALDEHVCLQTAKRCGIPAAQSEYVEFDGFPSIVVERYDRFEIGNNLIRVHQEDLCQALGIPPSKKYTSDGGPTAQDVIAVLSHDLHNGSKERFARYLAFNYLMGATDGHGKNYSILHTAGHELALAPLYDVASALPYEKRGKGPWRCAMSIGGENRINWLRGSSIARFEKAGGYERGWMRDVVSSLAQEIPDALNDSLTQLGTAAGASELGRRMLDPIALNCKLALLNLDKQGNSLILRAE